MMSKVLSDILDFNRMDEGRLVTVERPFRFHQALKSMLPGARIVGESRGLKVVDDFDPRIDSIARRASLAANGFSEAEIEARLADPEHAIDGMVSGDEMRIRQVVTNLLSNALKFGIGSKGPDPGKVTLRTRLILPTTMDGEHHSSATSPDSSSISTDDNHSRHIEFDSTKKDRKLSRRLDAIVVRIEVEDMGKLSSGLICQTHIKLIVYRRRGWNTLKGHCEQPSVFCKLARLEVL